MTVTVYGREGCYACKITESQLEKLSIPFVKHDVDTDLQARIAVESSGKTTLPMVDVTYEDGTLPQRWHGLRPERIRKLVNQ